MVGNNCFWIVIKHLHIKWGVLLYVFEEEIDVIMFLENMPLRQSQHLFIMPVYSMQFI